MRGGETIRSVQSRHPIDSAFAARCSCKDETSVPMRIENVKAWFPWAIAIVPLLWLPIKAPRVRRQRPEQVVGYCPNKLNK